MTHIKPMSRKSVPGTADTDATESIILLLLGLLFQDWVNVGPVLQNLTKYYEKT